MKIFFDTEFLDTGKTIDLLSIGLIREDGEAYYAETDDKTVLRQATRNPWLKENVISNFTGPQKPRCVMAREIIEFVGTYPSFWAYFSAWDWLLLIRLCSSTGQLLDSPPSWPQYCMDLKQASMHFGNVRFPPQQGGNHNALSDANWVRDSYLWLKEYESSSLGLGHILR